MRHVAIVGGSLAGVNAADGLRQLGFEGRISLIDADARMPYDKPPLSKQALAGEVAIDSLALRSAEWYAEQQVDLRLGRAVTGVDTVGRRLRLGAGEALEYDGLVVATGGSARQLRCCARPEQLYTLRSADDALRLRAELRPGRHLVIVGGGFIGLEVAATARSLGLDVTVIEAAPGLLSRMLPAALGEWFVDLHARNGVRIRCGAAVEEIVVGGGGHTVRLTDQTIAADIVLVGVGAAPEVGWLAGSGLEIADGVRCAPDLSVGAPGVVAAGDIARWHNAALGSEVRTEHWTNAVDQGRHAAGTLLGDRQAYSAVPYFWTDQYDAKARFVGQASADDEFAIGQPREGALVALFGRDGVVRGALCINAARHLATYRGAINERVAWRDAVSTLPN